jgi:hypothetical protein
MVFVVIVVMVVAVVVVVVAYDGYNMVNGSVIYIKTPFYLLLSSTTSTFFIT